MSEDPRSPEDKIAVDLESAQRRRDENLPEPVSNLHDETSLAPTPQAQPAGKYVPDEPQSAMSTTTEGPPRYRPTESMTNTNMSYMSSPSSAFVNPIESGTAATPMSDFSQQPQPQPQPTVTPLRLLADQSDTIDCPFCQRRSETKIKKSPSPVTYAVGTALFFTTVIGAVMPCLCSCFSHIDHHCANCGRRVTHRPYRAKEPVVFGTPDHLKEPSKYPSAVASP